MKKYAIIFSFLLVLLLFGSSFVAAADIGGQDPVMLENDAMDLSQGDNIDLNYENENLESDDNQANLYENEILESNDNQANLYENEATDEISLADDSQAIQQSNDLDVLTEDTGTYSELSSEIGSGGIIELQHDYYTYDSGDTIDITIPDTVIDGKGATIDMAESNIRAFRVSASGVTIKNLCIKNAYSYFGDGGAIYFGDSGTVENCNFVSNTVSASLGAGGAIYFGDSGTVINCNFVSNTASGAGGAIEFKGTGTLINCNFTDNTAADGGAVYFLDFGEVRDCNFTDNTAADGGAVYFLDFGEVRDSNFDNNTAENGGAIEFHATGTVENCSFADNKATDENSYGGALYFYNNGEVRDCNFVSNTARNGGAIWILNGNVKNCNFTNNSANDYGGAIRIRSGTVKNCNFSGNEARNEGGAIEFYGTCTVENCNFADNKATGLYSRGGAVSFFDTGEVRNCNFTDNTAGDLGGAIMFSITGNVTNCIFVSNSANRGGGIFSMQWYTTADTCIFKTDSDANNVNVVNFSPALDVDNFTTSESSGEKLTFDLRTNSGMPVDDGNISIRVYYRNNDSFVGDYSCLSGEGWAADLPAGSYYAIFNTEYAGFEPVNRTIRIMGMTSINCSDITVTYGEDEYLVATLKDSADKGIAGMSISVLLNGYEGNYTTDEDGAIKVPLEGLDAKDYIAEITFDGNEIYNKSSATVNVIVNKASSTLTVDDIELEYGDSTYMIVTPEGAVGISAEIDGEEIFVYNYLIIIPKLAPGNHTLAVTTIPDANHIAVTETANVEVINKTPSRSETQILYENMTTTAVDVDTDGRVGEYFYITLKDKEGNALANKPVQIGFNGNVYNRTTDKDGKAKLQINLKNAGTYTFAVAYLGDDDYNGSFIVAKIVVNKQKGSLAVPNKSYSASAKTKALTATFKSASGKAVKGKKITFTVNGKTYTATTDAKGVAKVNVSLNAKGTYSFTAKFAGNNMYSAISKTGKLTIK